VQADNRAGAPVRRSRKRRRLLFTLILFALICLLAIIALRIRLDDWARLSIQERLGEKIGGEVRIGQLQLELLRLEARFRDLELSMQRESGGAIGLSIPEGRVRLAWDGLLGMGERKLHLTELVLKRPLLQTSDRWLAKPEKGESDEVLPIDLSIDRLQLQSGSWRHSDRETRFDFGIDNLELQGAWSGDRRSMVGSIALETSVFNPSLKRPIDLELSTDFRWRGLQADFMGVTVQGAGLDIDLESRLQIASPSELTGEGSVVADLGRLNQFLAADIPEVGGRAWGEFELLVRGPDWSVEGDFEAERVLFSNLHADRATAHARYVPGRLELTALEAQAYGGKVAGWVTALVQAPATFELEIDGRQLDSAALLQLIDLPLPFASRVDTRFELGGEAADRGTWDGSGSFIAGAHEAEMEGMPIRGEGEFTFDKGRLRVHAAGSEVQSARLDFSMDMDLSAATARGFLLLEGLTSDARRTQLGTLWILDALGVEQPYLLGLPLRGEGPIEARIGIDDGNLLDLDLALRSGGWGELEFDRAGLELSLDEESLVLHSFDVEHGRQRLAGSGRWPVGASLPSQFELNAESMGLQALLPILELEADVDGRLSGQLSFSDGESGLRGSGRFSLVEGRLLGEYFEEATALIAFEGDEVRLAPFELHGQSVGGSGELVWGLESSSARVDLAEGFLDLQSLEMVRSRDLPLSGRLELNGAVEYSMEGINGSLEIGGADLHLMGQPLRGVAGEVALVNDEANLVLRGVGAAGWELQAVVGMTEMLPIDASLLLEESIFDPFKERTPAIWAKLSGLVALHGSLAHPEDLAIDGLLSAGEIFLGAPGDGIDQALRAAGRTRGRFQLGSGRWRHFRLGQGRSRLADGIGLRAGYTGCRLGEARRRDRRQSQRPGDQRRARH